MAYEYSDPTRENEPHAQPDVEVFEESYCPYHGVLSGRSMKKIDCDSGGEGECPDPGSGYFYAFGSPGCLWDSDPEGPFNSYSEALTAAREVE